ncbi:hypothetical protein Jolie1_079 [Mycobacterium phage Julie1]|uniref:Uncharacterized protein n=1 Tax=Mycobacterium phage Julie1 TaxID=1463812 RepID=W8EIU0_9CAUD|nr:hypothetical protein CG90_gp79 [Mycobacterium phage Julie1]AHJ88579.1 hypothetical protein Jolie1_079 [Mycobacterium phage Julie1]
MPLMADLAPPDVRLGWNIGPAERGLSDLGDHNAQPAWGSIETVDIGTYEGRHRLDETCVRVQLAGARWWMRRDVMACRQQGAGFCHLGWDGFCVGGTSMGRCHG